MCKFSNLYLVTIYRNVSHKFNIYCSWQFSLGCKTCCQELWVQPSPRKSSEGAISFYHQKLTPNWTIHLTFLVEKLPNTLRCITKIEKFLSLLNYFGIILVQNTFFPRLFFWKKKWKAHHILSKQCILQIYANFCWNISQKSSEWHSNTSIFEKWIKSHWRSWIIAF